MALLTPELINSKINTFASSKIISFIGNNLKSYCVINIYFRNLKSQFKNLYHLKKKFFSEQLSF